MERKVHWKKYILTLFRTDYIYSTHSYENIIWKRMTEFDKAPLETHIRTFKIDDCVTKASWPSFYLAVSLLGLCLHEKTGNLTDYDQFAILKAEFKCFNTSSYSISQTMYYNDASVDTPGDISSAFATFLSYHSVRWLYPSPTILSLLKIYPHSWIFREYLKIASYMLVKNPTYVWVLTVFPPSWL